LGVAACRSAEPPGPAVTVTPPARAVKTANVAGAFYPGENAVLGKAVRSYIEAAKPQGDAAGVVALFTPHAGYAYSGAIAGEAYAQLGDRRPRTFVLLGPSHHLGAEGGVAAPTYDAFATPLGETAVDQELVAAIAEKCDVVVKNDAAFAEEHAVEVQLPFIQTLAPEAKIAPFIFCRQDGPAATSFGRALAETLRGRDDVIIVCTCDLSHYHPYDEARKLDTAFVAAFKEFDAAAIYAGDAAGDFEIDAPGPVAATFVAGKELGANRAVSLVQRNSGDVTGDIAHGVVGYFAGELVK